MFCDHDIVLVMFLWWTLFENKALERSKYKI